MHEIKYFIFVISIQLYFLYNVCVSLAFCLYYIILFLKQSSKNSPGSICQKNHFEGQTNYPSKFKKKSPYQYLPKKNKT